jgi:hypothetical protein
MSDPVKERQTRFMTEIQAKVNYYIQEYHFTYAEIVGMLDAIKTEHMRNWLSESDENGEEV